MTAPYREPAVVGRPDVADRLECWLRDGDKGRWVRAVYVKLWLALIACVMLGVSNAPLAAIPAAVLGIVWASRDYMKRKGAMVVFTVTTGRVRVRRAAGELEFALDELSNVRLDTKAATKNLSVARADGVNSVFGAASNHNIEIDVSRIELDLGDGEPVLLDREFISSSLCSEQMRAIRLFLRAHGWRPSDERS